LHKAVIVDSRPIDQQIIDDHMKHLPGWELEVVRDKRIQSTEDYNTVMRSVKLWSQFEKCNRVLIFQQDSMILRPGIEEFMEWDYVGAPWGPQAHWARRDRAGGNGGLSLRNPRAMIETIKKGRRIRGTRNEDIFFTHRLPRCGFAVAPHSVCKRFSCEGVFALGTFGYHKIEQYLTPDEVTKIKMQYRN